mmetsp:Transcript_29115/g.45247  ORF Transcript_29115/g.45247 Transcript_29115/m.45247 type:complete len:232 (-) Transcript_29115:3-698(-)
MSRLPLCFSRVGCSFRERGGRVSRLSLLTEGTSASEQSSFFVSNVGSLQVLSSSTSAADRFEPTVDVAATSSFLIIALVFSLLLARANAVEKAAMKRRERIEDLRVARTVELTNGIDASPAVEAVKEALREEDDLRTIIPGVRIRAPNSMQDKDKDLVRQLLRAPTNEEGNAIDNEDNSSSLSPLLAKEDQEESEGMSGAAKVVLGVIAFSQLVLLYILSFDPMATASSWY